MFDNYGNEASFMMILFFSAVGSGFPHYKLMRKIGARRSEWSGQKHLDCGWCASTIHNQNVVLIARFCTEQSRLEALVKIIFL